MHQSLTEIIPHRARALADELTRDVRHDLDAYARGATPEAPIELRMARVIAASLESFVAIDVFDALSAERAANEAELARARAELDDARRLAAHRERELERSRDLWEGERTMLQNLLRTADALVAERTAYADRRSEALDELATSYRHMVDVATAALAWREELHPREPVPVGCAGTGRVAVDYYDPETRTLRRELEPCEGCPACPAPATEGGAQ